MMGKITSQLDRLTGMALLASSSNADGACLQFTGCAVSVYSRYEASRPLPGLIGLSVESVDYLKNTSLDIRFSNGDRFSLSLRDEHYVGPEAFAVEFADGTHVVE